MHAKDVILLMMLLGVGSINIQVRSAAGKVDFNYV